MCLHDVYFCYYLYTIFVLISRDLGRADGARWISALFEAQFVLARFDLGRLSHVAACDYLCTHARTHTYTHVHQHASAWRTFERWATALRLPPHRLCLRSTCMLARCEAMVVGAGADEVECLPSSLEAEAALLHQRLVITAAKSGGPMYPAEGAGGMMHTDKCRLDEESASTLDAAASSAYFAPSLCRPTPIRSTLATMTTHGSGIKCRQGLASQDSAHSPQFAPVASSVGKHKQTVPAAGSDPRSVATERAWHVVMPHHHHQQQHHHHHQQQQTPWHSHSAAASRAACDPDAGAKSAAAAALASPALQQLRQQASGGSDLLARLLSPSTQLGGSYDAIERLASMKSSSSLTSNVNGRLPSAEPMNPTPHASNAMSLATAAPAIASRTSSVASSPQRAAPKTKHSSSRRASADDASAGANKDFAATLRR